MSGGLSSFDSGRVSVTPPVQELHASVIEEMHSMLAKLQELWNEVGLSRDEQHLRMASLKDTVRQFYGREENQKKALLKKVDDKGQELFRISKELGVYPEEVFSDNAVTLLEMDNHLTCSLRDLNKEVEKRRKALDDLCREEQELCEQLIEDPSPPCSREVPSAEDLSNVQRRINTLQQEKRHRTRTFQSLKQEITELLAELDQSANNSFQNTIVNGDEQLFTLSLHNLDAMKRLRAELSDKVTSNQRELQRLQSSVEQLWARLEVTDQDQAAVLLAKGDKVPRNIVLYRNELERLEELKKANMERLVCHLRGELEDLWEQCYVGEEDREACEAYQCGESNEAVLTALESAVDELRRQHSVAAHLYAKLDHRKMLWAKLKDLEDRYNDPGRLFKNRGCALLQEERERNRVKGELPRVEALLQEAVTAWEAEHLTVFRVMGASLHEYMHRQWEQYTDTKLSKTKQRQTARAAQLEQEALLGARPGVSRRRPNAGHNNTALKRSNRSAASSTSSSTHKSALTTLSPTKSGRRGVLSELNTNQPTSRAGRRRSSRVHPSIKRRADADATTDTTAQLSTYSQFADNIAARSEKDQIRSSIMHQRSPRTPRNQTPLLVCRSPFKTPSSSTPRHAVPATLPRNFRTAAATPLPRVAMLPPSSARASPYGSGGRNRSLAASRQGPRGALATIRSGHASKRSPVARASAGSMATPSTMPRRRSVRLYGANNPRLGAEAPMLSTPAKNKLHFLI